MLVALDIGTSKIVTLVADLGEDEEIEIIASGTCPSEGMERGTVVDIKRMIDSIRKSVEDAELMLDDKTTSKKITSVYVGISGEHIQSALSDGMASIHDGAVSEVDMYNAIETAKAAPVVGNQEILHAIPREFEIDSESGIRNPEGMSGRRLEARVYMAIGGKYQIRNIRNCVTQCGLEIEGVVLEPIASGLAVLNADEKELGVCLIDIGGGTTDIAIYTKGEIIDSRIIPIAGDHVSLDIARVLCTPLNCAEDIKVRYGCTEYCIKNGDETIEVPALSDDSSTTHCKRGTLAKVIEARYEEIFKLASQYIRSMQKNMNGDMVAGIVLTGGGSKLEGIVDLANEVFSMPVRVGVPRCIKDSTGNLRDPIYATSFGLLLYAKDLDMHEETSKVELSALKTMWLKVKRWYEYQF